MKKILVTATTLILVSSISSFALAQCESGGCAFSQGLSNILNPPAIPAGQNWPCQGGNTNFTNGNTDVNCATPRIKESLWYAARDGFSPHPLFSYSSSGIDAAMTHKWNQQQSQTRSWHGGHNYWRWARPTALVVPPTASFGSQYSWGVGQTKSLPIYHQFGRTNPGSGGGPGQYADQPYWPSSTQQMGVYPVRASW